MVRLSLALYLAVGLFPYLVSGVLVPPAAVTILVVCWVIGLVATLRFARHRPVVAPLAVLGAIAVWFAFVSVGSAVFGWTA